jgi:hypothetical protein
VASGVVFYGNPVIGHMARAGNRRVFENVETTTTCIRYVPSVLSCHASSAWCRAKRSESCSPPNEGPCRQMNCSREPGVQ